MAKFAAAVDQGTTSTRCMIFEKGGGVVSIHQMEHEQIYPKPGWVEHDAMEIWARTQDVVKAAVEKAGAGPGDIRQQHRREHRLHGGEHGGLCGA